MSSPTSLELAIFSEAMTARDAEDGSIFTTTSPSHEGVEFVIADEDGERRLIVREAEREYLFCEVR